MYQELYNLLLNGIYGDLPLSPDMTLTLTLLSTIGCVLMIALPFILVYGLISRLCR